MSKQKMKTPSALKGRVFVTANKKYRIAKAGKRHGLYKRNRALLHKKKGLKLIAINRLFKKLVQGVSL